MTDPQLQQQAGSEVSRALHSLEQVHGLYSGINWAALIPLIVEAIRIIIAGQQQATQGVPPKP